MLGFQIKVAGCDAAKISQKGASLYFLQRKQFYIISMLLPHGLWIANFMFQYQRHRIVIMGWIGMSEDEI